MRIAIGLLFAVALIGGVGLVGYVLMGDAPVAPVSQQPAGGPVETVATPTTDGPVIEAGATPVDPSQPRTGPGVIHGRTVAFGGVAVGGVEVRVELVGVGRHPLPLDEALALERTVTSDPEGVFRVESLPLGTYAVVASIDRRYVAVDTHLAEQTPEQELELLVEDAGEIRGRVVDPTGTPVAGAQIFPLERASAGAWNNAPLPRGLRAISDAAGEFTLTVPLDEYRLLARAAERADSVTDWTATGGEPIEIVLTTGFPVTGRLTSDEDDAPLASKVVILYSDLPIDPREATTAEDGSFTFEHIGEGTVRLSVRDPRWVLVESPPRVEVTGPASAELVAAPGAVFTGRVVDALTEKGVSGVVISAMGNQPFPHGNRSATSDDRGRFRVEGLAPGLWWISRGPVDGYPMPSFDDNVQVLAQLRGEVDEIEFSLQQGASVAGRVVDPEGEGVAGAVVVANSSGVAQQRATTDAEGYFSLTGYRAGNRLSFAAASDGWVYPPQPPVEIPEGGHGDVVLRMEPEARIEGVIVDVHGDPRPGLRLTAARSGLTPPALTDAEGRFEMRGLTPGKHTIRYREVGVTVWGEDLNREQVQLTTGQHLTGLRWTFHEGDSLAIEGRVVDRDGRGIGRATVNAWSDQGGAATRADENGEFRLPGLANTLYTINASHAEYAGASQEGVRPDGEPVELALAGRGGVEGVVVDAETGRPIPRYRIRAVNGLVRRLNPWQRTSGGLLVKDDEGRFRLDAVVEGTATLVVQAEAYVETLHPVEGIVQGETVTGLTIALEPGLALDGVVLDPQRRPVAGAKVYVGKLPGGWFREQMVAATTGPRGDFRIPTLQEGAREITVQHPDFALATFAIGEESEPGREFILKRGGRLQGEVSLNGVVPEKGKITVATLNGSDEDYALDSNGGFDVRGVSAGEVIVTVEAFREGLGEHTITKTVLVDDGKITHVSFDLTSGTATLEGQVNANGRSFQRATLTLTFEGEDGGEGQVFKTRMAEDGSYRFTGLPGGKASVVVEINRGEWGQKGVEVEIPAGETVVLDIDFGGGAVITGVLRGVEGAVQTFFAALKGEFEIDKLDMVTFVALRSKIASVVQTKSDGTFQVDGLDPGTYTLVALASEKFLMGPEGLSEARYTTAVIELKEGEQVEVELEVPAKQ